MDKISEIYRIEEAPASMLTGIELFQHRFSGNLENQRFFLSWRLHRFQVPRFRTIFGDLFLGKILVANYRIVCEVNFAPKAQNFSTDIRKSAVLDAVLEDKPAQPLPCGSYLVIWAQGNCAKRKLIICGCHWCCVFQRQMWLAVATHGGVQRANSHSWLHVLD